jgi:hypothetical protein
MPAKLSAVPDLIYQLKITLRGSKPPIWRRVLVPGKLSLYKLHRVIQTAMGWQNDHLHQFITDDEYYSIPDEEGFEPALDERRYSLSRIAPEEKMKFVYEYDFGDGWEHTIVVEKILPPEPGAKYPRCIAGKRACPPEDVGGVCGYEAFLEAIRDPKHKEHEMFLEWIGGDFDPEVFDLEATDRALKRVK